MTTFTTDDLNNALMGNAKLRYTVERHGEGYGVYFGRNLMHHGLNLAHLTECLPEFAKQIETALNGDSNIVWCECGDSIEPDSGAICGNCIALKRTEPAWKTNLDKTIVDQQNEIKQLRQRLFEMQNASIDLANQCKDYESAFEDVKRLTRELDIALNGDGAAKQASLCDVVCQVKSNKWKLTNAKPLTYERIAKLSQWAIDNAGFTPETSFLNVFARAIEAEHGIGEAP